MKLQITAEGMELTKSIKKMVEEKLGENLDKHLRDFEEDLRLADVVIKFSEKIGFEASFNMFLPKHKHFYAHAVTLDRSEKLEPVIVRLREEIEVQLERYKGKINKRKR